MKEYDMIAVGSGSAMNIISPMISRNEDMKVAVIDKDEPGGICLTRGCIPSKILVYPAEVIRTVQNADKLGIKADITVDFNQIMKRMRNEIGEDIENIREGLSSSDNIDYFHDTAKFVDDYTLEVAGEIIRSRNILLCLGSSSFIPDIEGLEDIEYITSTEFLQMETQPSSIIIIGGGYIAAEYGHFLSALGTDVTIIGRNVQFVPDTEPEVGALAKEKMEQYIEIITGHEVVKAEDLEGIKKITAKNTITGESIVREAQTVLIATGRVSNSHLINPEKSGIETDEKGWIKVNNKMQTTKEGIWSFGDAIGKYLLKHVANKESVVAYYNIHGQDIEMDYHAIPGAIFTYPEMAYVGMKQKEAEEEFGKDNILIGFHKYEDTAKGIAMGVKDYFVKVILTKDDNKIRGCHIIGPKASILIQEVINLMYTNEQTPNPINSGMHIHPSLSEVVERAFGGLMTPDHYDHFLQHHGYSK